jgi:hypothetical protein
MAYRNSQNCDSCRVILIVKRNFNISNWCKGCNNWKPKEQVTCECCGQRLRSHARSKKYVTNRKRI